MTIFFRGGGSVSGHENHLTHTVMTAVNGGQASRPVVAVSSCLLGQPVRYDGVTKRDDWIAGPLAAHVDYLPVCPEVAIGMGVPRPPIHLVGDPGHPRAVGVDDPSLDVTGLLQRFARQTVGELRWVSGYILKARSPSCAVAGLRLPGGRTTAGLHAATVMARLPLLPVVDEEGLADPVRRENFINRVYAYRRWQDFRRQRLTRAGLADFHARHRYLLMAHSQAACRRLDRLVSDSREYALPAMAERYAGELMAALGRPAGREQHLKVLCRILDTVQQGPGGGDSEPLAASVAAYRHGEVPLIVPLFLLRQQLRRYPDPCLDGQWYLNPYPDTLGLRNNL